MRTAQGPGSAAWGPFDLWPSDPAAKGPRLLGQWVLSPMDGCSRPEILGFGITSPHSLHALGTNRRPHSAETPSDSVLADVPARTARGHRAAEQLARARRARRRARRESRRGKSVRGATAREARADPDALWPVAGAARGEQLQPAASDGRAARRG